MILENKEYKFSNNLDLSEDLYLDFDFYINFMGQMELSFNALSIADYVFDEIAYRALFYIFATEKEDGTTALDTIPAYIEGLGGWECMSIISGEPIAGALYGNAFRTIVLPATQEVEGGEWILNNLRKTAANPSLINFTIAEWPEQTFQAAVGSTWTMYELSSYNPGIIALQSGKMAYDGQYLLYNQDGSEAKLTDEIIENGIYHIPSQLAVRIDFSSTDGATLDPMYVELSSMVGQYVPLLGGESLSIPLHMAEDWYIRDIPTTKVGDYLTYEVSNGQLKLKASALPEGTYESLSIELPRAQKTLVVKLDTIATTKEDNKLLKELHPSLYRVNVKGNYYSGDFYSLKIQPVFSEGTHPVGLCFAPFAMSYMSFIFSEPSVNSISDWLIFFSVPVEFVFSTSILEYINQEVDKSEIYGEQFLKIFHDEEQIKSIFITKMATKAEMTELEYAAQLQAQAEAAGVAYNDYLISKIEAEYKDSMSNLVVHELNTIDSENFDALVEVVQGSVLARVLSTSDQLGELAMIMPSLFLLRNEDENVIPQFTYAYSAEDARTFGVFNNSKTVQTNTIFSENNDFNFTVDTSWSISSYTAPTDKLNPGTLTVTIGTSSGDGDGTGCLSGDTLISTPDGDRRIDGIRAGDIVVTPRGPEKVIYSNSYLDRKGEYYDDYYFSNEKTLRVIHNHRIYSVDRGCVVLMSSLVEGEQVAAQGATAKFLRKERHNEQVNYYSLWTENSNLYYANGILCGNYFSNFKSTLLRKIAVRLRCWIARQRGKKK